MLRAHFCHSSSLRSQNIKLHDTIEVLAVLSMGCPEILAEDVVLPSSSLIPRLHVMSVKTVKMFRFLFGNVFLFEYYKVEIEVRRESPTMHAARECICGDFLDSEI